MLIKLFWFFFVVDYFSVCVCVCVLSFLFIFCSDKRMRVVHIMYNDIRLKVVLVTEIIAIIYIYFA